MVPRMIGSDQKTISVILKRAALGGSYSIESAEDQTDRMEIGVGLRWPELRER